MLVPSRFKNMKTVATEYPQADCTFWLMPFESLLDFSLWNFPSTVVLPYACEPIEVGPRRPKSVSIVLERAAASDAVDGLADFEPLGEKILRGKAVRFPSSTLLASGRLLNVGVGHGALRERAPSASAASCTASQCWKVARRASSISAWISGPGKVDRDGRGHAVHVDGAKGKRSSPSAMDIFQLPFSSGQANREGACPPMPQPLHQA